MSRQINREYRQAWHKTAFRSLQLNLFGPHVGARKVNTCPVYQGCLRVCTGIRKTAGETSPCTIQSSRVNTFNIHISYLRSTSKAPPLHPPQQPVSYQLWVGFDKRMCRWVSRLPSQKKCQRVEALPNTRVEIRSPLLNPKLERRKVPPPQITYRTRGVVL